MNISEPFVRRPIATSLLAIGLMLVGAVAYRFLPVAPLPQVDFPSINVSATYSGVDPETAATSLAAPLERRFANIAGVNEITSVSQLNGTRITLQFDLSRDINGAARDVQAAINAASSELPPGLPSPPTYRKANPNDLPVLILALTSDSVPLSVIYNQAVELLVPALSQVPGVSEVDVGGGARTAVRIQVDPAALASMGLSIDNVRAVLQSQNKDSPKGAIDGNQISFTINANDQLFNADQYKNLIIGEKNGVPIPLSAVGRAIDATEDRLQAAWFNSKRAVVLFVRKQADANVIETVDRMKAILPQLERWLPPAIHLDIQSDRTITIRASVADVQTSLLISVGLVVVVCFVFLRRVSTTFIACVTVPLALAGTFAVMYLLKFSLDNISLMALTISVGFVVDDAIVVIENIVRHLEQGLTPLEATLAGCASDRLYRSLHQHLAGRGLHSAAVYGRDYRPAIPRVCRDPERRHPRFRRRVTHPDSNALFAIAARRKVGSTSGLVLPRHGKDVRWPDRVLLQLAALGAPTFLPDVDCHGGDHLPYHLALHDCSQRLLPSTGHRLDHGDYRSRARYLI